MPVSLLNVSKDTVYTETVYADANLFIFSRDSLSSNYQVAASALGDLISQNVGIFISNLVIDEMWWGLLRVGYRKDTGNTLYGHTIKNNPLILRTYSSLIERATDETLSIPNIQLLPQNQVPTTVLQEAKSIYMDETLAPRDCFHLALVKIHNIGGFITSDSDFDNLSFDNYDLAVYKYWMTNN